MLKSKQSNFLTKHTHSLLVFSLIKLRNKSKSAQTSTPSPQPPSPSPPPPPPTPSQPTSPAELAAAEPTADPATEPAVSPSPSSPPPTQIPSEVQLIEPNQGKSSTSNGELSPTPDSTNQPAADQSSGQFLRPSPSETSLTRSRSLNYPPKAKHSPDCKDNPYKF